MHISLASYVIQIVHPPQKLWIYVYPCYMYHFHTSDQSQFTYHILHWFWNVNEIYAQLTVQYKNIALLLVHTLYISLYHSQKS